MSQTIPGLPGGKVVAWKQDREVFTIPFIDGGVGKYPGLLLFKLPVGSVPLPHDSLVSTEYKAFNLLVL